MPQRKSISGQVGAYAVPPGDMDDFLAQGFTLALTARFDPACAQPADLVLLDPQPMRILRQAIYTFAPHHKTVATPIVFSKRVETKLHDVIRARIEACAACEAVAGCYLQDDYIGNVAGFHERTIAVLHEYGLIAIIGLGCSLDYDKTGSGHYSPVFASRQHFCERELLNWTPSADGVLLYNYSLGNQPNSDYAMRGLLPYQLSVLETERHGFDFSKHMLIGGVQCWEPRAKPSAEKVAEQCAAFAGFGARAVCAFTWHNFTDGQPELCNDAELRAGLQDGMARCREVWEED